MTTGFIYFLRCGEFVKIGYSKSPTVRFRTLETAIPFAYEVLATHPGTRANELALHKVLREHHHRREWFRWCDAIAEIVQYGLPRFDTEPRGRGPRDKEAAGRLAEYLADQGITLKAFAATVHTSHASVSRLCSGKQRPSWDLLERIYRATNGAVTPNDFIQKSGPA